MFLSLQRGFSPFIHSLLDDLNRLIGPVYLVGGALRHALQHRIPPDELNLLSPHALSQCRQRLEEAGYNTVLGIRHNSLLLPLKRQENPKVVEIATFRHHPGQPPSVEEDLSHRDITSNAMAFRWPDGPFIDPFQGRSDLQENCIRLVNGAATLTEDPLRALRFFRFTLQMSGRPDPRDLNQCAATLIGPVAHERIRGELDRIFSLPLRDSGSRDLLQHLFDCPLGRSLVPEFTLLMETAGPDGASAWLRSLGTLLIMTSPAPEEEVSFLDLRWTALLAEVGRIRTNHAEGEGKRDPTTGRVETLLQRLQFSKRRLRRITSLIQHLDLTLTPPERVLRRLLDSGTPVEGLFRLIRARQESEVRDPEEIRKTGETFIRAMRRCQLMRESLKRLRPCDLALTGGEIMDMARLPPGPWLGKLREALVDWVGEDLRRNQRDMLANQVQQWLLNHAEF
ncbi:MAG: CCA tRNA nucleotidyltransferase [Magnetococcales bacterium]|nr:CCA tRNA nucleotidyltransferase [Magnetococcales bacterium]